MELLGFYYDTRTDKIEANGYPIPKELVKKGYVQKNNANGEPRWYVMTNKVWIIVLNNGKEQKYNMYTNIMAIYPRRERISLKLVQEVISRILNGEIVIKIIDGKPFLDIVDKRSRKRKK